MQVVLCAALGVTIVLAWWVCQLHAAALSVKLGDPQPIPEVGLVGRLPVGWTKKTGETLGKVALTEPKSKYRVQRTLTLRVWPLNESEHHTIEEIASDFTKDRPSLVVRKLDFLGTTGILLEYPTEHRESEAGEPMIVPPQILACTITPGPIRWVVTVRLDEQSSLVPADFDLVEAVAKSLIRSDNLMSKAKQSPIGPVLEE